MADERIVTELTLDDSNFTVRMKRAGKDTRGLKQDVKSLDGSIKAIERRISSATSVMRDWSIIIGQSRNVIHQLSFVTIDWMKSIVRVNAEIERTTYLMRGLSKEVGDDARMRDAVNSMDAMFEMARNSPFEIGTLTDSFVKMRSVGIDPAERLHAGLGRRERRLRG